jgi:hemoglobin
MTQPATSLYQRMGGYDVIAAVIDDLFAILHDDRGFARFFGGPAQTRPFALGSCWSTRCVG